MDGRLASVIPLADAAGFPTVTVGSKAATLSRLAAAGFPVPALRALRCACMLSAICRTAVREISRRCWRP